MPTLFGQAVTHIKAGDIETGKRLLTKVLKQNPRDEKAWLWMTKCVVGIEQKRYCYNRVLNINPQNQHALKWLDKPAPPNSRLLAQVVQQPMHQRKLQKRYLLIFILAIIGLLSIICIAGTALLFFPTSGNSSGSSQQNNPVSTQTARPSRPQMYIQILEANGFVFFRKNSDGSSFASPCGAVANVTPNSVGFAVDSFNSDTSCAAEDTGEIITTMYPLEVIDFVLTATDSLNEFDQIITGTAVGYDISVTVTESGFWIIIIKDPH